LAGVGHGPLTAFDIDADGGLSGGGYSPPGRGAGRHSAWAPKTQPGSAQAAVPPADLPEHRYWPQRSERAGTFRSVVPRGRGELDVVVG